MSVVLTKEAMEALKTGKEVKDPKSMKTPTAINLYKDKIEWIDAGRETAIKDHAVEFILSDKKTLPLTVMIEAERLFLILETENCRFPFKKES